ncbi:Mitochondrial fission protein [Recurvomyces mirabilis]|nr:Mitochondrial fission protein [Recurvomyces mirabilis]
MSHRGRSTSPRRTTQPGHSRQGSNDENIFDTRQIEAFGRTVQATASQLISANFPNSEQNGPDPYRSALTSVQRQLRRPLIQRSVFSFTQQSPRELLRAKFSTTEVEHRALSYIPQELIRAAPAGQSPFSLFEGFKASLPESDDDSRGGRRKPHGRHGSKLLEGPEDHKGPPQLVKTKKARDKLDHRLEMMGIRKTMCAGEIREIDAKIANMNTMRKVVLERLAGLEQEENDMEQEIGELSERLAEMQEQLEDEAALATQSPSLAAEGEATRHEVESKLEEDEDDVEPDAGFMSESIYGKLPKTQESPKSKKRRGMPKRTISMPVLHEHMEPGSRIREVQAHNDSITAMDFDAPFGTLVTAALDDTVRVWDLNAGRCMGMLEGHLSSVRCLQVEDNLVATGSMDASIRLWDLSQADYNPQQTAAGNNINDKPASAEDVEGDDGSDGALFTPAASVADLSAQPPPPEPHGDAMADCHVFTLSAHVAEITALNFRGNTLVSGSADKTLRQWDLEKGRCVQTLDVLWAAAQASAINPTAATPTITAADNGAGWWKSGAGRLRSGEAQAEADFVGAVQVFDAALACGTADGMVRLWDLRSGMVHRSLVGHTGPVTALQFDDVYLVTGSRDRSIRIWDLRTGTIHDAFAYDNPISSMQFDARRIIAAAGEDVVKVYDKADGRQWDCGAGVTAAETKSKPSIVERVRIKDGYMVEGRRDGIVGVWSC